MPLRSASRLSPANNALCGLLFAVVGLSAPPLPAGAVEVLTATPSAPVAAPGQQVVVAIGGTSGALSASSSASVVTVSVDSAQRTVTLKAVSLGTASVHVSDAAGNTLDLPVAVLPVAGSVPDTVHLTLTGDPAAPEFIAAQIDAAVTQALAPTLAPGSIAHAPLILPAPRAALASGFLTSFSVPVRIDPGPGTLGVAGTTTVEVINAGLAAFTPRALSFRDDPERITANGVLSRTTVDVANSRRIYYYHENMRARRRFCVVLTANDSVITRVQLIGASAGPNIDVMSVGHAVSKTFVGLEPYNEGTVVEVHGGIPFVLRDTNVGPGDGIVGALDVRVLSGGPLTATVMALPLGGQPASYLYAPKLPDDGHTRHGNFDLSSFGQRIIGYTSGGRDAAYAYGNRQSTLQNADLNDAGRDYGDYGVLQRVTFDLDNPLDQPATIYLYEKPLGGVVRSSFALNGTIVDVGCARLPRHYVVSSYTLAARATATIDVLTMTDGGSNYPLEIGMTATPPNPIPPIRAADGCFPKPPAGRTSGKASPGAGSLAGTAPANQQQR